MRLGSLCILACLPLTVHAESVFYKYQEATGETIINDTLPPEAVSRGYTVINNTGRIVQVVPPAKTPEEIAYDKLAKGIKAEEEAQEKRTKEAQDKMDNLLRQSFDSMEDIEHSEKTQLNSVQVVIKLTNTQIERLNEKLKTLQAQATTYKEKKQAIPDNLKGSITEVSKALDENMMFLKNKNQELIDIQAYYKTMKDRFVVLKSESKKEHTP